MSIDYVLRNMWPRCSVVGLWWEGMNALVCFVGEWVVFSCCCVSLGSMLYIFLLIFAIVGYFQCMCCGYVLTLYGFVWVYVLVGYEGMLWSSGVACLILR